MDTGLLDEIPKVDLHHHLDGAVRTETMLELAQQQGKDLPADTVSTLNDHVQVSPDCRSLTDFLDCFEVFYPLLQEPEAMNRVAYELCEDLEDQGVLYTETRFAPVLMTHEGASMEEHVEAVLDGLRRGQKDRDVTVKLILCLYRGTEPSAGRETLELAAENRDRGIVGVDLAGDESQYDAEPHAESLELAHQKHLYMTMHAGEAAGAENIREAMDFGTDRIGHGVQLSGESDLKRDVKSRDVTLEVCLTSNLQTQAVESLDKHPVKEFLDDGLSVTINTDDPNVSNTDINREYRLAVEAFDLTDQDVADLLYNGLRASFLSDDERQQLTSHLNQHLKKFGLDGGSNHE